MLQTAVKTVAFVVLFFLAGALFAYMFNALTPAVKQLLASDTYIYRTSDQVLLTQLERRAATSIGWADLLPEFEQNQLQRYRPLADSSLSDQILQALESSQDQQYAAAMQSTNVVNGLLGQTVAISGFVVPIDMNDDRTVKRFFLVPYYGACIHYPPPPPNQILYVSLADGMAYQTLTEAVTLTGVLSEGLFEDPLGTSSYMLELIHAQAFYGEPDDFRQHQGR